MTLKVVINGYGRIGRNVLRALYEAGRQKEIRIVAVNDLGDAETNAYLTRHDTVHGRFRGEVRVDGNHMVIDGDKIRVLAERDPAKLPWGELGVDTVFECTGLFTSKAKAGQHLVGGAKRVILSAPGEKDVDATIVYGVNHKVLKSTMTVISNASCTTNCLVPLVKPLHDAIGVKAGIMTTIHSYTNDQVLTDVYHKDLRRARSATMSMIPTKTGAAAAVGLVLPELNGTDSRSACPRSTSHWSTSPSPQRGPHPSTRSTACCVPRRKASSREFSTTATDRSCRWTSAMTRRPRLMMQR